MSRWQANAKSMSDSQDVGLSAGQGFGSMSKLT